MNKQDEKEILVYADWEGKEAQLIGVLNSSVLRGKEMTHCLKNYKAKCPFKRLTYANNS